MQLTMLCISFKLRHREFVDETNSFACFQFIVKFAHCLPLFNEFSILFCTLAYRFWFCFYNSIPVTSHTTRFAIRDCQYFRYLNSHIGFTAQDVSQDRRRRGYDGGTYELMRFLRIPPLSIFKLNPTISPRQWFIAMLHWLRIGLRKVHLI